MKKKLTIGIIGAGIQGISNALFLQKKGFEVTISSIFQNANPCDTVLPRPGRPVRRVLL